MFNWDKISKEDRIYIECLNKKLNEQEKEFKKNKKAKNTFQISQKKCPKMLTRKSKSV